MRRRLPWFTAATAAAALLVWFVPGLAPALIYDRDAVLRGQLWRLWTGHLVHFSASHLGWDLLALVAGGLWLETRRTRDLGWFWLTLPLAISGVLLAVAPSLWRYGGLSGLATGVIALAACDALRDRGLRRVLGALLLPLIVAGNLYELVTLRALLSRLDLAIRPEPLAHLTGLAWAGIFAIASRSGRERDEAARFTASGTPPPAPRPPGSTCPTPGPNRCRERA